MALPFFSENKVTHLKRLNQHRMLFHVERDFSGQDLRRRKKSRQVPTHLWLLTIQLLLILELTPQPKFPEPCKLDYHVLQSEYVCCC